MLMPSIFGENLFDDWFDFPSERDFFGGRNPLYGKHGKNLMKTDVRETDGTYELDIDLPGFKKEDITAELKDGYLTINASKGINKDEKDTRRQIYPSGKIQWHMQPELLRRRRCCTGGNPREI